MSDIKIFYSSKRIKKIINDCDFLDIFSTYYCCNYLRDGNNLTSLAIHYLERKQNCILFIFMMKIINYEPDLYDLIKNIVDMIGFNSKYCNNALSCARIKQNNDRDYLNCYIPYLGLEFCCSYCRKTSYSDVFNNSMGYVVYDDKTIYSSSCRSQDGCYCKYRTECYVCELCEYGIYCKKQYEVRTRSAIKEKSHKQLKNKKLNI